MNGLAVMLCVSLLGVQQTWRTTQEGQLEYVLQVEPTFLASLEQGESITSNLPASAKEVHRLCLRISAGDLKKVKQRTPELPPLATAQERAAQAEPDIPVALVVDAQGQSEEITDISHGWLAGKDGRVQYLVQLSPDLLGKLQDGDEIYMNVYPEAGQIQEFIVLAGKEILPRKATKAHPHATLTAKDRKTVAPAGAESPTVYGPVASEAPVVSPRTARATARRKRRLLNLVVISRERMNRADCGTHHNSRSGMNRRSSPWSNPLSSRSRNRSMGPLRIIASPPQRRSSSVRTPRKRTCKRSRRSSRSMVPRSTRPTPLRRESPPRRLRPSTAASSRMPL